MDSYILTTFKELGDTYRHLMGLNKKIAELEKQMSELREQMSVQELRAAYLCDSIANHGYRENVTAQTMNMVRPVQTYSQPVDQLTPPYQTQNQAQTAPRYECPPPMPAEYRPVQISTPPATAPVVQQPVPTAPVVSPAPTSGRYIDTNFRETIVNLMRALYVDNKTIAVQQILDSYNIATIDEATEDIAQMLYADLMRLRADNYQGGVV